MEGTISATSSLDSAKSSTRLGDSGEMPSMPKAPAPYEAVSTASRNHRPLI
jgi:hypothetical protein